jgi:hypothetical protein
MEQSAEIVGGKRKRVETSNEICPKLTNRRCKISAQGVSTPSKKKPQSKEETVKRAEKMLEDTKKSYESVGNLLHTARKIIDDPKATREDFKHVEKILNVSEKAHKVGRDVIEAVNMLPKLVEGTIQPVQQRPSSPNSTITITSIMENDVIHVNAIVPKAIYAEIMLGNHAGMRHNKHVDKNTVRDNIATTRSTLEELCDAHCTDDNVQVIHPYCEESLNEVYSAIHAIQNNIRNMRPADETRELFAKIVGTLAVVCNAQISFSKINDDAYQLVTPLNKHFVADNGLPIQSLISDIDGKGKEKEKWN